MNLRATNPRLTPPRRGTGHAGLPSWEGLGWVQGSQCMRTDERGLSMNRSAELQFGAVRRAPNAPTWRSALQENRHLEQAPTLIAQCHGAAHNCATRNP